MEQKRFQDIDGIFDTTINDYANTEDIIRLLNDADKQIKDLEEENTQLKQKLHDLPKKIVSEIRKKIGNKLYRIIPEGEYGSRLGIDWCEINRLLDTILKKYGGVEK